ncbi:MAG: helix-turn-helix domain-containing protein [bacterium]|nr:helix-turn-helix domain-containing protein [bacterium]
MTIEKTKIKRAYTIQETAEYAGVSRGTVLNWLENRLLPFEVLPGRGKGKKRFIRIRKTDLDRFLDDSLILGDPSNDKDHSIDFSMKCGA